MWYAISAFSALIFIFLIICLIAAKRTIIPKTRTLEETKELEFNKDKTVFDFYESHLTKGDFIESRFGYNIAMYYFLNNDSNKFVIMAHGYVHSHHGVLKYAKLMYKLGYNVITFDQRYHGNSGGKNTTLGYLEKYDLYDIISKVKLEFGDDILIGTYGESMGGATALFEQAIDDRVSFCISDCAFSDFPRLMKEKLHDYHLPSFIHYIVGFFIRMIIKVKIKDISPVKAIKDSHLPILFIHGKQDKFINYQHSVDLYESYSGPKALYLADNGATHTFSYHVDPDKYKEVVNEFLKGNTL